MLFRKSKLPSRASGKGYMCREPTFKPYDFSAIGVGSHPRSPQGAGERQTDSKGHSGDRKQGSGQFKYQGLGVEKKP